MLLLLLLDWLLRSSIPLVQLANLTHSTQPSVGQ